MTPRNPHGALSFDGAAEPTAIEACVALVASHDEFPDEVLQQAIELSDAGSAFVKPAIRARLILAARQALAREGYR